MAIQENARSPWSPSKRWRRLQNLRLRLPVPDSVFVLEGHENHPVNLALVGMRVFNYTKRDISIWIRPYYLMLLIKWTLVFGLSSGRLIALLQASRAYGVVTLEADDRANLLLDVSQALPDLTIIALQHSRHYEAPHLFNSWPTTKNLRIMVWGEDISRTVEILGRPRRHLLVGGSIRLAQYCERMPVTKGEIDILVCIKLKGLQEPTATRAWREKSMRMAMSKRSLLQYLGQFARDRELRLTIPWDPRGSECDAQRELELFSDIAGVEFRHARPTDFEVGDNGSPPGSTYSLLRVAKVVVGVNTSLLYDAVLLRSPVVYAWFGNHHYNSFPLSEPWVLQNPSYDEFSRQMISARSVDDEELAGRALRMSYFLKHPSDINVANLLRQILKRGLESESLDEVVDGYDDLRKFSMDGAIQLVEESEN